MIPAGRRAAHPGSPAGAGARLRWVTVREGILSNTGRLITLTGAMKQLVAIVRPFLAERVLDALKNAPLEACSVREVKGYGRQKSYLDEYRDSEYSLAFLPKVQIIVWVDDARADEVARQVVEVARTGRMGDGKVFLVPNVPGAEKPIEF